MVPGGMAEPAIHQCGVAMLALQAIWCEAIPGLGSVSVLPPPAPPGGGQLLRPRCGI